MQPDPRIHRYAALWLIPGAVIAGTVLLVIGLFGNRGELAVAGAILIGSLILSGRVRGDDAP